MNFSTEKKIMDLENRLVVAKGEGEGVGGIGSLGLTNANYCSWNRFAMRSCCVALRTMSRYLYRNTKMGGKSMYTCMCNLVPMLHSGKKNKLQIPYDITYNWNLTYSTNEPFHRKENHRLRE